MFNQTALQVHPNVYSNLDDFALPESLGFGRTMVPILYKAVCEAGQWLSRELRPYQPLQIDPAAIPEVGVLRTVIAGEDRFVATAIKGSQDQLRLDR